MVEGGKFWLAGLETIASQPFDSSLREPEHNQSRDNYTYSKAFLRRFKVRVTTRCFARRKSRHISEGRAAFQPEVSTIS